MGVARAYATVKVGPLRGGSGDSIASLIERRDMITSWIWVIYAGISRRSTVRWDGHRLIQSP
ncbi:hypothetical protein LMG27177_07038 [Paraburkholderia fynbosensis]|uniref:Uncharacterized protein n=1 Tax=Paraburkholderia fynbosensis TaxID=1200993 RepID=A0A6J5H1L5_9BURK|nr:hypothetical protein LMG27177_07038 [Paraburkholderia fynbosensis]